MTNLFNAWSKAQDAKLLVGFDTTPYKYVRITDKIMYEMRAKLSKHNAWRNKLVYYNGTSHKTKLKNSMAI